MLNSIKEIMKFQDDAGLTDKEYSDELESSMIVEEALEGFECLDVLAFKLGMDKNYKSFDDEVNHPKEISRWLVAAAKDGRDSPEGKPSFEASKLTDVQRLDKACDQIIIALGSIAKLKLNAQEANQALLIVNKKNMEKIGCPRDEKGKLTKPDGFEGPEPLLQILLDKSKKKQNNN